VADQPFDTAPRSAETSITCPSCGREIPLTRALRAEIEASMRREFDRTLEQRERDLRRQLEQERDDAIVRAAHEAASRAERNTAGELTALKEQLADQEKALNEARGQELALRRRERELESQKADLEVTVARTLDDERGKLIEEAQQRVTDEHRLKDAEKERQLADMRRQIEDLKRKAEQGSQQLQGEAGEDELEATLRANFPMDDISGISQGTRGADIHQVVVDPRGARCGAILWECKNTKHYSDAWIQKLKDDQRALRADVAVLVTAALPRGCARFTIVDGLIVTDFACAAALAVILRTHLVAVSRARSAASTKEEQLELLHRYLTGVEFRQRVEAIVEAFETMRADLDQERRAAERQWAKRAKQIDAVTLNISGMYGDLQGLVALAPIDALELPCAHELECRAATQD
jgi:hypothetical protein